MKNVLLLFIFAIVFPRAFTEVAPDEGNLLLAIKTIPNSSIISIQKQITKTAVN